MIRFNASKMAILLDKVVEEIKTIKANAIENKDAGRPRWPMIILKTPKGWTGPKFVNGLPVEGTFRSHQVPLSDPFHKTGAIKTVGRVAAKL